MKPFASVAFCFCAILIAPARGDEKMPTVLNNVGMDQKLDQQVPLDLVFKDETGRTVQLGDYLGSKPVILVLVQYKCPMLCGLVLNGLATALGKLSFDVGKEFNVITVSFDTREKPSLAVAKKSVYVESYGRSGADAGWHFLTGEKASIDRLTESIGFRYAYEAERDRFAHPSGLIVLTPKGKIARYFFGVEYSPRDLRLGLVEAAQNKIGSSIDQVMLFCFGYDPKTGKYSASIMKLTRMAAIMTVLSMGVFVWLLSRRNFRRNVEQESGSSPPDELAAVTNKGSVGTDSDLDLAPDIARDGGRSSPGLF